MRLSRSRAGRRQSGGEARQSVRQGGRRRGGGDQFGDQVVPLTVPRAAGGRHWVEREIDDRGDDGGDPGRRRPARYFWRRAARYFWRRAARYFWRRAARLAGGQHWPQLVGRLARHWPRRFRRARAEQLPVV